MTLHVVSVHRHPLSVLYVHWIMSLRGVDRLVRPVVLGFSVRLEMLLAVLVMFLVLAVQELPPLVSTVISTIS